MNNGLVYVVLSVILCCITLIVLAVSKIKPIDVQSRETDNASMIKFTTDYNQDPYPQNVDIENEYECTVEDPHPCKLDDYTTLFGCKNLAVTCKHFDEDTKYQTAKGDIIIIPKSKEGEGLALAIDEVSTGCNLFHGDWVLVSTNPESREFGLICLCKDPGYIGNETVTGACNTAFICNGNIDDIDKPLSDINCICSSTKVPTKLEDGTPTCADILVKDATSEMENAIEYIGDTIDSDYLNPTVSQNMKIKKVLNPCKTSLFGNKIPGELVSQNIDGKTVNWCSFIANDNVLQYKTDLLKNAYDYNMVSTGFVNETVDFEGYTIMAFAHAGRPEGITFCGNFPELSDKPIQVLAEGTHLDLTYKFIITWDIPRKIPKGKCYGDWPSYHCYLEQVTPKLASGSRMYGEPRSCPDSFLWGKEDWDSAESTFSLDVWTLVNDNGEVVKPQRYTATAEGVKYFRDDYKWAGLKLSKHGADVVTLPLKADFEIAKHSDI